MATTTKGTARKAAPKKATAKTAPRKPAKKAEAPKGRAPVHSDAEITRWVKAEAARLAKAGEKVTTAGLLRTWRGQGGRANPGRFAALVADATK
jgi:hypothetical protein